MRPRGELPAVEEVELQPCCDFGDSDDDDDLCAAYEETTEESSSSSGLDAATRTAVGVGARVLFYPSLFYNLARKRLSPSSFRWWDRVDGTHILLGAAPLQRHVPRLQALGVGAVLTLTEPYERLVPAELYDLHGMDNLVLPTPDYLYAPSPKDLRRAVEFIHVYAEEPDGKLTYVHCKAGRARRSVTVVMCYLVRYKGMTPEGAYKHVKACRPRVSLAEKQRKAVDDFHTGLIKE